MSTQTFTAAGTAVEGDSTECAPVERTPAETILDGGCSCGAVRYTVRAPAMIVHCCHCSWCQRETGSAFVINGVIERDRIDLSQGELAHCQIPTASGKGQRVARCGECHTALWSHYAFAGIGEKVAFLRVGTLDDPAIMPPDVHIFTAHQLPWLTVQGKTFTGYYRSSDVWSDAGLARKRALGAGDTAGRR